MKLFFQKIIYSQLRFYRYYRRKGFKRFFKENILETEGSNLNKSLSVALGIFVGLTPLWGFHTIIVLFLAAFFRLNKLISYMCTHISFPVFIPFIIMASLRIGALFLPGHKDISAMEFTMETVKANLWQYIIGSTVLAIGSSALLGALTYLILNLFRSGKPN